MEHLPRRDGDVFTAADGGKASPEQRSPLVCLFLSGFILHRIPSSETRRKRAPAALRSGDGDPLMLRSGTRCIRERKEPDGEDESKISVSSARRSVLSIPGWMAVFIDHLPGLSDAPQLHSVLSQRAPQHLPTLLNTSFKTPAAKKACTL